MGIIKRLRQRRLERKAAFRAAKVRAKADAKEAAKLEKAKEKYLRKTAKQVRKMDAKERKARRKHEKKMAEASVEQLKAGQFNSQNVLRYISAARVATPVAIPLLYRLLTQLQSGSETSKARRAGVTTADLGAYPSDGAPQKARIAQIRKSVRNGVASGFAKDVDERMDVLEDAIDNSRDMSDQQTRRVLDSVSNELDLVEAQIATKRG